jgi:hypothetical protein
MKSLIWLLALGLLTLAGVSARAAELTAEETAKAEDALKRMDTDDTAQRSAAESDLRNMGGKVTPVLSKAKLSRDAAQVRVREILVDLTIEHAPVTREGANTVGQVAREEALAKRYLNASKCYRRAEKMYQRLKDDAGDRKDKASKKEFEEMEKKSDKRADKADVLAAGGTERKGLNLGFVHIGTEKNREDDNDW